MNCTCTTASAKITIVAKVNGRLSTTIPDLYSRKQEPKKTHVHQNEQLDPAYQAIQPKEKFNQEASPMEKEGP